MLRRRASLLFLLLLVLAGCRKEAAPTGPADVMMQVVSQMRRVHGEPEDGDAVVDLLWKPARDNLKERARRASALSGRELSPGELLVPSWFAFHIVPERAEARIDGEWAEVTLYDAAGASVQARCFKEEDGWKVALGLPVLAPIRMREAEE